MSNGHTDYLTLIPLSDPSQRERLMPASAKVGGRAARYRLVANVRGSYSDIPTHAVYAIWKVKDDGDLAGFKKSRLQLFALRATALSNFAFDLLLEDAADPRRLMVLGFYADERGATTDCREHPSIKAYAARNPASGFKAEDTTGLLCFRVASISPELLRIGAR